MKRVKKLKNIGAKLKSEHAQNHKSLTKSYAPVPSISLRAYTLLWSAPALLGLALYT